MIKQSGLFALAAVVALGGCSGETGTNGVNSAQSQRNQCFPISAVTGFRQGPTPDEIYVDVGPRDVYLFQTFGPCPDLDFSWAIGFATDFGDFVCDALDVDLVLPQATVGPRRCPVRMIRKLTPEEVQAL